MIDLTNKSLPDAHAVVTGGACGIGASMARSSLPGSKSITSQAIAITGGEVM